MFTWLATFVALLKSLPEIMGALTELKKLWDENIAQGKRRDVMADLEEGIRIARVEKDTTKLNELLNSVLAGDHSK